MAKYCKLCEKNMAAARHEPTNAQIKHTLSYRTLSKRERKKMS